LSITDTGCDCFNLEVQKESVRKFVICNVTVKCRDYTATYKKGKTLLSNSIICRANVTNICRLVVQKPKADNSLWWVVMYIRASSVSKLRRRSSCRRSSRDVSYSDLVMISELYDQTFWNLEFSKYVTISDFRNSRVSIHVSRNISQGRAYQL
jgi:hypothetical protein